MADTTPRSYSSDPTLYLYTSLTAGSSHIVTATSRLETILKANRIPFQALDVATDEKARMLWGRRSKGKKLPGLVRHGMIVGDLEEVEEWNEYGELKQQIGSTAPAASSTTPSGSATNTPSKSTNSAELESLETKLGKQISPPSPKIHSSKHIDFKLNASPESTTPGSPTTKQEEPTSIALALRQAGEEAAKKAEEKKAEKNAAFKASLSKDKDVATAETATPSQAEPTASQVRNAPTPNPEAVNETVSKPTEAEKTEASEATAPITTPAIAEPDDTLSSPVTLPPSTSLGGDPPPLHYSPKATPAMSSSSSIAPADDAEEAEHHRKEEIIGIEPNDVIEEGKTEETTPEKEEEGEGEKGEHASEEGAVATAPKEVIEKVENEQAIPEEEKGETDDDAGSKGEEERKMENES